MKKLIFISSVFISCNSQPSDNIKRQQKALDSLHKYTESLKDELIIEQDKRINLSK